ncbi:unnamed protein product [Protopolystoma xenopodis]|uniref:Uncharacterized protein n=1 Tax=Protopolystoma xenopodis TaxID=117903 RepID=A0A448WTU6_9PLAT|nr:unnamed protein product [Protopolystoma xenopodis]
MSHLRYGPRMGRVLGLEGDWEPWRQDATIEPTCSKFADCLKNLL